MSEIATKVRWIPTIDWRLASASDGLERYIGYDNRGVRVPYTITPVWRTDDDGIQINEVIAGESVYVLHRHGVEDGIYEASLETCKFIVHILVTCAASPDLQGDDETS